MFARTERLLLRPPFTEDASALAAAIGDEAIVRNLATAPWPYGVADAAAWVARPDHDPLLPNWLMLLRSGDAPRIVGGIGVGRREDASLELGYWVARPFWGLGFATEAGRQLLRTVRANGLPRLTAGHFIDNPASAKVLRKLGFRPTGQIAPRFSLARGGDVACALYEQADDDADSPMPVGDRSDISCAEDFREELRLLAA
jgi:RimJ/RimL family protein N-acetyltransferase